MRVGSNKEEKAGPIIKNRQNALEKCLLLNRQLWSSDVRVSRQNVNLSKILRCGFCSSSNHILPNHLLR